MNVKIVPLVEITEVHGRNFFISWQQEPFELLNRTKPVFDWFFAILLLFLVILALIRLQNPNIFFPFRQILSKKKQKNTFSKTENASKKFGIFLMVICSWIGFSIAFADILSFFNFPFPFEPLFFPFIVFLFYFSSKYLLGIVSAWLLQIEVIDSERRQMAIYTNFVWVLISFPLVVINHYTVNDYLIWIICFIFCVNFLQKLFFTWIIISKKLKPFEILMYLCSIDILLLLLFARYIINCFL